MIEKKEGILRHHTLKKYIFFFQKTNLQREIEREFILFILLKHNLCCFFFCCLSSLTISIDTNLSQELLGREREREINVKIE